MDKFAKARTAEEVAKAFREESPDAERLYLEAEAAHELTDLMKAMRTAAHISQLELARRVGRAQPFIARLEKGAYDRCSLPTLRTFARALGFDIDFSRMFSPLTEASFSGQSSCSDLERTCRIEEIAGDALQALELSHAWSVSPVSSSQDVAKHLNVQEEAQAAA